MKPIPDAIERLIQRCEVNEVSFDNDDMSVALSYARLLRLENEELKASIRGAWLRATADRQTTDEFANACGVSRVRLIEWLMLDHNPTPESKHPGKTYPSGSESDWEYEQFRDEYDPENDCPRCQGSGTVVTADYQSYFGDQFKTCPECGGNRTKR